MDWSQQVSTAQASDSWLQKLSALSNRLKLHHVLFWALYLTLFTSIFARVDGFWKALTDTLIVVSFHAIAVYVHLYYFLPRYLLEKRYVGYSILLGGMMVSCAYCSMTVLYLAEARPDVRQEIFSQETLLGLSLGVFFSVAFTTALQLIAQWYTQEKVNKAMARENIETELRFLKSQIQPHFLFNILNNIYSLALQKSDRTPDVILKLSDFLRYVLYESREKRVPIEKEINYMRNYIDLEQVRQGNDADIQFQVEGDPDKMFIEPLLLLPFLENSFKHGLNKHLKQPWVKLTLNLTPELLTFTIANSHNKNLDLKKDLNTGGIGIENVKRRLELLYPGKHRLQIDEADQSFTVTVKIHLS